MDIEETGEVSRDDLLRFSTDIVASYVRRNTVPGDSLPGLINTVFEALNSLDKSKDPNAASKQKPAVSIRRSITSDHLVCLEDGKKLKMLKRYIRTNYSMTPNEYRAKWGLPHDYPMVAPNYAKQRSEFAKTIGLGKNGSRKRSSSS